ncbi:MAG: alkaline phosphatase D family protein [Acidobacteriota bacterium]
MRTIAVAVLTAAVAAAAAAGDGLRAGPMLGWATMREATVWVQTERPARVTVRLFAAGGGDQSVREAAATTRAEEDNAATLVLDELEPGTTYRYELAVDGAAVTRAWPFELRTQPLWQWRTDPPDFTAMIGSCLYVNQPRYDRPGEPYGGGFEVLAAMARLRPDLMVWLGDNLYLREVDLGSPHGIRARYRHDRALPELQPLLAATRHYATWDDHDFGPNDSDASFMFKDAALAVFARYWPAPAYGLPGTPGVFQRFVWGDVEFVLLDDRMHRSPNAWPDGPDKRMLGAAQMEWLKRTLVSSRATFKVVALGNQALNRASRYESLHRFRAEYDELLSFVCANRLAGVLFVSGDRHHTELIRVQPEGCAPLLDFTSSPLTAGVHRVGPDDPEFANPDRVPGTLVTERGFGVLRFTGPRTDRTVTLEAFGTDGAARWTHATRRSEMVPPAAKP